MNKVYINASPIEICREKHIEQENDIKERSPVDTNDCVAVFFLLFLVLVYYYLLSLAFYDQAVFVQVVKYLVV